MAAPTIQSLPTPPSRNDEPDVFVTRADAFLGALPTFGSEANTLASFCDGRAASAEQDADSASSSAASAVAAANFKGRWSTLSGALNIPASVEHDNQLWILLQNVADVASHTPGVSTAWIRLSPIGVARFTVVSTSSSYTAGFREWVEVTAAGLTITLPASPPLGAEVAVAVGNFTNTVIARNGQSIMGLAENMTIDLANRAVPLIFVGGTFGWRLA